MGSQKKSTFISSDVVFDKESMLQEKSKNEDKAQDKTSNRSADTQKKKVEFSESPKRPEGSEEDFLDSN